jgi:endogenous inhibitor of DNA gyrase (YacG/DUF329 family)
MEQEFIGKKCPRCGTEMICRERIFEVATHGKVVSYGVPELVCPACGCPGRMEPNSNDKE